MAKQRREAAREVSSAGPTARVAISAVALGAIFICSFVGLLPPAARDANAPPQQFSAVRGWRVLDHLVGSGEPHPVGSAANDAVRAKILANLTQLGYAPQVQTGFGCTGWGDCATARNILAELAGRDPQSAVLLVAHYDSVPAGPGAADDGAGVAAVLEIARILKISPQPRNSVILLLDEGEELGMIGSRVFVSEHPWAKRVRAAVNLEARGNAGPSLMFETGSANDWAVRLWSARARRPAASSIFYTLYKRLPNDTDFTVFKAAGYQGLNFAFLGHEPAYHTPLDSARNLSLASMQHEGDNALVAVEALANADLSSPPPGEAEFFDVFGRWLIHWRTRRTIWIALGATLLLLAEILLLVWMQRVSRAVIGWGAIELLIAASAAGICAFGVAVALRGAGAMPVNWVAHPVPLEIVFWCVSIATTLIVAILFARVCGFWGLWIGTWLWWLGLGLLGAFLWPGISYLQVAPLCVAVVAAIPAVALRGKNRTANWIAALLPALAAGAVGFAPLLMLYPGMGLAALTHYLPIFGALVLSPVAALCVDLREARGTVRAGLLAAPFVAAGLAILFALIFPAYSLHSPERLNLQFWEDADSARAAWVAQPDSGRLPDELRTAANFRWTRAPFAGDRGGAFLADAPHLALSAPTFTLLQSEPRGNIHFYRILLRSERGAPVTMVLFPQNADASAVTMNGRLLPAQWGRHVNNWIQYSCWTTPAEGVEMSFALPSGKPVEVLVADRSFGLPGDGDFLERARPLTAVPSQNGDTTVLVRRVQLFP